MIIVARFASPETPFASELSQLSTSPNGPAWNWSLPICHLEPRDGLTGVVGELFELADVREATAHNQAGPAIAVHGPLPSHEGLMLYQISLFPVWNKLTNAIARQLRAAKVFVQPHGIVFRPYPLPQLYAPVQTLACDSDRTHSVLTNAYMRSMMLNLDHTDIVDVSKSMEVPDLSYA